MVKLSFWISCRKRHYPFEWNFHSLNKKKVLRSGKAEKKFKTHWEFDTCFWIYRASEREREEESKNGKPKTGEKTEIEAFNRENIKKLRKILLNTLGFRNIILVGISGPQKHPLWVIICVKVPVNGCGLCFWSALSSRVIFSFGEYQKHCRICSSIGWRES